VKRVKKVSSLYAEKETKILDELDGRLDVGLDKDERVYYVKGFAKRQLKEPG
jgi:hypothetical protein